VKFLIIGMMRLEDHVEIEKRLPNPGEAMKLKNILMRLKDHSKSECGP
jgi:hypothetical protein